ncbi:MAG TPA: methyl-accepting chemotaxis protein [Myxococcota bacterium]
MTRVARGSINQRLARWMLLTTSTSLLVACTFFVVYDTLRGRDAMVEKSALLARVVGINSAVALTFEDEAAALETLSGLGAADEVRAAAIYDRNGGVFATYLSERGGAGSQPVPAVEPQGHRFEDGELHVFQKVHFQGEEVGYIYLSLDASALTARLIWYLTVAALLIVATVLLAALASVRMRHQISQPLEALLESSKSISEGDLSKQVDVSTDDEFGVLAKTFNGMTAGLRDLVDQVRQSILEVAEVSRGLEERGAKLLREAKRQAAATSKVGESVERVTASIRDVNANVEQLADTSHETSASIVEMEASIGEIASHMDRLTSAIDTTSGAVSQLTNNIDQVVGSVETLHAAAEISAGRVRELCSSVEDVKVNAAESHLLSEDSSRAANQGMTAVNETIEAMGEISSSFRKLQNHVSRLAVKSQSIDEIVQVITGVAEQTGLLSLNAAIIAAQAGEHGKAFSVVAEQVSGLADRTHRSAREIAELIQAVQQDTTAAVGAVEEGSARVERGVQRSHVAGEVLNQILEKAAASTNRVREIVDATANQSDDLVRVDSAVREVQEIVEQINQATHDQHAATKEIAEAVGHIRNLGTAVRHSTEEQRRGSGLITRAATSITEMVSEIAESTSAQRSSSSIIQHALQVFKSVTEETNRSAEAINTSVSTLSERAERLEAEIGRFKTG